MRTPSKEERILIDNEKIKAFDDYKNKVKKFNYKQAKEFLNEVRFFKEEEDEKR